MIKQSLTLDETIEFLNELIKIDRAAIENLLLHKVECNIDLMEHESVQVRKTDFDHMGLVGFLGILNGMFGIHGPEAGDKDGWGAITAIFTDEPSIRLQEFKRTTDYNPNPARKDKSENA